MERNLLPLGSIVSLEEGNKRLMICGRIQVKEGNDEIYDYCACLYPEGIIGPASLLFFNDRDVDRLFFIGFQDEEELLYNGNVLSQLGELEIRNGQIVEVE